MEPETFGPQVLKLIETVIDEFHNEEAKVSLLLGLCMQMHYEGMYQSMSRKNFKKPEAKKTLMHVYKHNATALIGSLVTAMRKGYTSTNTALGIYDGFVAAFGINPDANIRDELIKAGERP